MKYIKRPHIVDGPSISVQKRYTPKKTGMNTKALSILRVIIITFSREGITYFNSLKLDGSSHFPFIFSA